MRIGSSLTIAAMALLLASVLAAPAHAGVVDVDCAGISTVSFSPGITFTPRNTFVTSTTTYAPCVSLTDPSVTSGTNSFSANLTFSCMDLLVSSPATSTVNWSNGQSSTFDLSTQNVDTGLGIVITAREGAVVSGEFSGATIVSESAYLLSNLLGCYSQTGLTSLTGPHHITITSP